jgi:hypothetical protein
VALIALAVVFAIRHAGFLFGNHSIWRAELRVFDMKYVGLFTLLSFIPSVLVFDQLRARLGAGLATNRVTALLAEWGRHSLVFFVVHVVAVNLAIARRSTWEHAGPIRQTFYAMAVVTGTVVMTMAVQRVLDSARRAGPYWLSLSRPASRSTEVA